MNRPDHSDDVLIWDDGTWCYRCDLWEMDWMSDDFSVLYTETPEWINHMELYA